MQIRLQYIHAFASKEYKFVRCSFPSTVYVHLLTRQPASLTLTSVYISFRAENDPKSRFCFAQNPQSLVYLFLGCEQYHIIILNLIYRKNYCDHVQIKSDRPNNKL